jgi:hypothetical protein
MFALSERRMALVAAVLSTAMGTAQGQEPEAQARTGAVADGVSSLLSVATGAVAVNPLLPVVGLGFKAATFHYTGGLPETERTGAYAFAAATWQGSAAANACATASALSGGAFLPACVAMGVAWGWKTWNESARERRLAERCAVLRDFVGKPKLPCAFMPRGLEQPEEPAQAIASANELVAP